MNRLSRKLGIPLEADFIVWNIAALLCRGCAQKQVAGVD